MWLESPYNGELINFAEVYKIKCHKIIGSTDSTLEIKLYFFSKDVDLGEGYHRNQDRTEIFFDGDLDTGTQLQDWLEDTLNILKFTAIARPPVEVVIDENHLKRVVDIIFDQLRKIERLLPKGLHLEPFLQEVIGNDEAVNDLLKRKNNGFMIQKHNSWKLDYDLTRSIAEQLSTLATAMTALKVQPELTDSQKEALRSIMGENTDSDQ